MPKGKKKQKRKPKVPPLSPLNKLLYWTLFFLFLILLFSFFILFAIWQQQLGKANHAIAVESTASELLILIPLFPAIVLGIGAWGVGYQCRIPLIKPQPKEFSKPRKKHSRLTVSLVTLAVVLWLGSFVPVIGAVYNRIEINNTHIDTYAMFGRLEEHRPIEKAMAVHVKIYCRFARYTSGWEISYTIRFADGKEFTFQRIPSTIIELDNLFQNTPKTVSGTEYLDQLCEEYHCTSAEREQLKALLLMDM